MVAARIGRTPRVVDSGRRSAIERVRAGRRRLLCGGGQGVRLAACSMTFVTAPGSAIIERWGASISVMWAPALWAIAS